MGGGLPPLIGAIPEMECIPAAAKRIARRLRTIHENVDEVTTWADKRSADGAGWTGDAAEASDHTSTRYARRIAATGAALYAGIEAAHDFESDLEALDKERTELDTARITLNDEIRAAAAPPVTAPALPGGTLSQLLPGGASPMPLLLDPFLATQLTLRQIALSSAIRTWGENVTAAEERFIAALAAVDTYGEGAAAVDEVEYTANLGAHVDNKLDDLVKKGVLPADVAAMTPEQLREYLIDHPETAALLLRPGPTANNKDGTLDSIIEDAKENIGTAQDLFDTLSPRDAALIALLYPDEVGNMDGAPFPVRADANLVGVIDALDRTEYALAQDPSGDFRTELEDSRALYQSIITNDRQIILFDEGHQRIAELHGTIDANTKNVGVLVPGTFSDISNFQVVADRSQSFVDADYSGGLAMISWQGGEFPPSLIEAASKGYADDLAPKLASFSEVVQAEIDHSGAGPDTRTTYAGHSYGGAVVGLAETYGLQADRVLHIESAGMGQHVDDPSDLPASQDNVDRYSMTDEDDFISLVQGAPGGHGADPDTFDGTTRLATGLDKDGDPIVGLSHSHSAVFQEGSEPWENMFQTFTGGTVTTFDPSEAIVLKGDSPHIDEDSDLGKQKVDID